MKSLAVPTTVTEIRKKVPSQAQPTAVVSVHSSNTRSSMNEATFEVDDAYNPMNPNDYIKFCEERLEKKRLLKLEEDNKRLLEEQERERKGMVITIFALIV